MIGGSILLAMENRVKKLRNIGEAIVWTGLPIFTYLFAIWVFIKTFGVVKGIILIFVPTIVTMWLIWSSEKEAKSKKTDEGDEE